MFHPVNLNWIPLSVSCVWMACTVNRNHIGQKLSRYGGDAIWHQKWQQSPRGVAHHYFLRWNLKQKNGRGIPEKMETNDHSSVTVAGRFPQVFVGCSVIDQFILTTNHLKINSRRNGRVVERPLLTHTVVKSDYLAWEGLRKSCVKVHGLYSLYK